MKKILLLSFLLLSISGCGEDENKSDGEKVYICTGKSAYAYHSNNGCRGLTNCQEDIVLINMAKAQKMGRKACEICY